MTRFRGPAWNIPRLAELAQELEAFEDAHLIGEFKRVQHQGEEITISQVEHAKFLVGLARMLHPEDIAAILCDLYDPHELAYALGHMATNVQFVEAMGRLKLCGVGAHHERDAMDLLVITGHLSDLQLDDIPAEKR